LISEMVYHWSYTHLILSAVLLNQLSSDEKPWVDAGRVNYWTNWRYWRR